MAARRVASLSLPSSEAREASIAAVSRDAAGSVGRVSSTSLTPRASCLQNGRTLIHHVVHSSDGGVATQTRCKNRGHTTTTAKRARC